MDPNRLNGKNIMITGAAQGMGAANAEYFAAQGANVCLGDINMDGVQEVAERINSAGVGEAVAVKLDVTKRDENAAAVAPTNSPRTITNAQVNLRRIETRANKLARSVFLLIPSPWALIL